MFSSKTCRFVLFSYLSLSANAENIRGAHRELEADVNLGTAGDYAILSKAGIATSPTSHSTIYGDIAVSPAAQGYLTGFSETRDSTTEFSTSGQVNGSPGKLFAADYGVPTPNLLTLAIGDMGIAYDDVQGRTKGVGDSNLNPDQAVFGVSAPLQPGVYTFDGTLGIGGTTGVDIHFAGSSTDIFIIQVAGDLTLAADTNVILDGTPGDNSTPQAKNIFWQVAGLVDVGEGAHMEGTLLVWTSVTFRAGSTLDGRVLTHTNCALTDATIDSRTSAIGS
jgi:hypothetical protein